MTSLAVTLRRQRLACLPNPDVYDVESLSMVPTLGLPLPVLTIWVERETGLRQISRLIASTAETDPSIGVQRPYDYYNQVVKAVWFTSGG